MTQRRVADTAPQTSQATGHREARALTQSMKDASVRELLVTGGLLGFTPVQMFPERAA